MTPPQFATARALAPTSENPSGDFARDLVRGLRADAKAIPCKYFYDSEGSKLFEKICEQPEYYPTRTELALLTRHADEFAGLIGPHADIVEFGAGASEKIRPLLRALDRPHAYVPVDISGPYLMRVAAALEAEYPHIPMRPVVADFTGSLEFGPPAPGTRRIGFFPGSTIGNFEPDDAKRFLTRAAQALKGGGLLIGVDLVKNPARLHAAYNDRAGVTAAFNMNLLRRANREAGAHFDPAKFAHYAFYEPLRRRVGMYLVSLAHQRICVGGHPIVFAEGEPIHTEWSHKYTVEDFRTLAASAGFVPRAVWCDAEKLFSIHWLEAN
jgi:dimethylhistidine N-methyltransferase